MDIEQFRKSGRQMVDYIADYYENIRNRPVIHNVSAGYLAPQLPDSAPEDPEDWQEIFKDIERVIMPGVSHWRSPRFHGYYAAGGSFPSLLADMLCDAIGCIGFSWTASPACTELEMVTTDWLAKMLGLPAHFRHSSSGQGGGVIQTTACEAVFLCLLAARKNIIHKMKAADPDTQEGDITSRLIAYTSDEAHSSVNRAGILAGIRMRKLATDDDFRLRGKTFQQAIDEDKRNGDIPFYLCATLGTTGTCAFDDLKELGPICEREGVWLHVDAAYAGSAFACPEFRHYLDGVEYAETFSVNPHKWMLCNFDLSVMWIRNRDLLVDAFRVDSVIYPDHKEQGIVCDYRHWQIPLARRFRALKLWFVLRSYGVKGIQAHIRRDVALAKQLDGLLKADGRFEMPAPTVMGLVCIRLKGSNDLTESLFEDLISKGKIFVATSHANKDGRDVNFIRVAMVAENVTPEDVRMTYEAIRQSADCVMRNASSSGRKRKAENGTTVQNGTC
ncbi:hypothetical protein BaRGS_00029631, partial [Batillaria attramentaria]